MIYRITVYPEVKGDPICHQEFVDEDEMNADEITRTLSYFVVHTDANVYKYKSAIEQALRERKYKKFYKLVRKVTESCINELEG